MILPPKVIAIDDDKPHLDALIQGLQELKIPSLPIWYQRSDTTPHKPIAHVRVLFSDLHLLGSDEDNKEKHFAIIQVLLSELIGEENGPYVLVLWTRFPEQAEELSNYLAKRLTPKKRPVTIFPINKKQFFGATGKFKNKNKLLDHLSKSINKNPQVAALIDWEMRALTAAGVAVAAVDSLIPDEKRVEKEYSRELKTILSQLASAAMGLRNVDGDKLGAINQALSPILSDSLVHLPKTNAQKAIWSSAYKAPNSKLGLDAIARLNRMIHVSNVATNVTHKDRGVVLKLSWTEAKIKHEFGYEKSEIYRYFKIKPKFDNDEKTTLLMIQIQPPCDYANHDQKFLPYALGVAVKSGGLTNGSPMGGVWKAPNIEVDGQSYQILFSSDFLTRFPSTRLRLVPVWFRFREEILNDLSFSFSKHMGRPGIYSFRS